MSITLVLPASTGCWGRTELYLDSPATGDAAPGPDGRADDVGADAFDAPLVDSSAEADASDAELDATVDASDEADGDDAASDSGVDASGGDASDGDAPDSDAASCTGWSSWNEGLVGGQISAVAFDPSLTGTAYAAAGGRLYRSSDSGKGWAVWSDDAGAISDLAFVPGAQPRMLAASNVGVRSSTDAGKTWATAMLDGFGLRTILVHPAQPLRIVVGADLGIIMTSPDGGSTWQVGKGVDQGVVTRFVGDPVDPSIVLATEILEDANGGWTPGGGVIRSTDGGASWQTVYALPGRGLGLARCAQDPSFLMAASGGGLAQSLDGGATWTAAGLANAYINDVAIAATDCNVVWASIEGKGIVRSTDHGASWSPPLTAGMDLQPGYIYADALLAAPDDPAGLLARTHGGLFAWMDAASSWAIATGIVAVSPTSILASPLLPDDVWMSSWGSGIWRRTAGGTWQSLAPTLHRDWVNVAYPDEYVSGRVLVGASVGGGDGWLSTNGGGSFSGPTISGVNPGVFVPQPSSATIFMGTQVAGVQKSTDGGSSWQPSNTGIEKSYVRSLAIDPSVATTLYAGTANTGVFRSTDAGTTWSPTLLASGTVSCLFASSVGPPLYACVDNQGIYTSQDGMTWTPANIGLGSLEVGGAVLDAADSRVFVSAGKLVYWTTDGTAWQPLDPGCSAAASLGHLAIVGAGTGRSLVATAGTSGILRHPL